MSAATYGTSMGSMVDASDLRWVEAFTRWTFTAALALLCAMAVSWLMRQPAFAFHRIRLDGELVRASVATIRANALPLLRGNFFTIDLQEARAAFESVPWIRHAEVRRVWPAQLLVRLQEHRAVALWEDVDAVERRDDRLVGDDGTVFQANPGDVEDEGLPTLRGPRGSAAQVLEVHRRLSVVVAPLGRSGGTKAPAQIRLLELSSKGSWTVELDTGARILIGRGTPDIIVERTERFARTVPQITQNYRRPLLSADLRHSEGYALHLSGITTAPGASPGAPSVSPRPARVQP
jgi:cell division protein FtsQ